MRQFFLILIACLKTSSSFSQLNGSTFISTYFLNEKPVQVLMIEYFNYSNEIYYLWFSKSIVKISDSTQIRNYFSSRSKDFSLSDLIYEGLMTYDKLFIFETFIKVIKPDHTFRVHILSLRNDAELLLKTASHIIVNYSEKSILDLYDFDRENIFSYRQNDIVFDLEEIMIE